MLKGDPTTKMSEGSTGESAHLVGKLFGVSGTYVKQAKKIWKPKVETVIKQLMQEAQNPC